MMRLEALHELGCPDCRGRLTLVEQAAAEADGHVMRGGLRCAACDRSFAIQQGVPVLLPRSLDRLAKETAARFATEWTHWSTLEPYYERQFLDWVAPVQPADFAGKRVLEGGCGKGRHTHLVATYGAASVISIDLGESAWVAFANTRSHRNVHVVMGDVLNPPVLGQVDVAFSVGVLHHLTEPELGLRALTRAVRPGGRIVVWVYGRENNEWIVRFVDPVRKLLASRAPPGLLRAASWLPSAALFATIRGLYRPDEHGRGPPLPYGDYFAAMHTFPLQEIHSIVFDQLVTPVAAYLSKSEVDAWFASGFRNVQVRSHRGYSWSATAEVA